MKFYKYLKSLFCICLVFGIATSAMASDISGTWVADVDNSSIEMTFMLNGTTLTGTIKNSATGSAEIREGKIDGSKISFHILSKLSGFGDSEFKIAWSGEVIGDEILFKREFAGTSKGVIAKRRMPATEAAAEKSGKENIKGSYDHLSGTWTGKVPLGQMYLELQVNGASVSGTVNLSGRAVGDIKDGKIEGDKITFHTIRQGGLNTTGIPFEGTVKGEEIHFSFISVNNGKPVNFVATKTGSAPVIQEEQATTEKSGKEIINGSYDHLSGTWSGKVPLGETYLELQVKGSSVSGTVSLGGRNVGEIKDGKIEADKITFHAIRQEGFSTTDIPFEGIIKGEKIHFSFISVNNGRPVNFIATKIGSGPDDEEEQTPQEAEGPYKHIAGKWTASYLNGVMSMNFRIKGNILTGTVSPAESTRNDILDGKIENNKITFHALNKWMNMQKADWEGTIIGDKIHFSVKFPTNTLKFIAKKVLVDEKGQAKEEVQLPPTTDPSGTWAMEVGGQRFTMNFKAVGMSLTGVIKISPTNRTIMIPPDAKISGDTVSFKLIKMGMNGQEQFPVPWEGKVVGNEIHFEGGPFNQFETVIAKKIKGADSNGKEIIKLVRNEEIKNSMVNQKYKKLREEDKEYDAAMDFFDKYQYHLALPLLEQIYSRITDDAVILHRMGVSLVMQSIYPSESRVRKDMRARARGLLENAKKIGMEDDLLDYYLQIIPSDGGEDTLFAGQKKVEESLSEGERLFGLRDFQTCIGLYARTMEMDPTNYKAVLYIGDSYFAAGQSKDAIEWFERATKVNPHKETAWRYWGDCLMHQDKKDEGRLKFIDALIAEPYNQLSWNGIRNLVNMNKLKLETPDIKRPQRLDTTGELLLSENSGDGNNDQKESTLDGTDLWKHYNEVAKKWRAARFNEKYPKDKDYRHTLEEEKEALELVAVKVNKAIKKGEVKSKDLNPGLKTLLELHASDLLEPYILFHLADRDIIMEYPAYRKSNRGKLEQYLDIFEVPKIVEQRES